MRSFFLTFDVEDFISENSIRALYTILELLKKHELSGLFFITGTMAEKLSHYPKIVALLREHQIGYHSSSHSIHPTLFEFTDTKDYEEAYQTSLVRETAHINPFTGEIEGSGGIKALRALFPKKQIDAFRAPGYCWTPPHLEALKTLGIRYDFSTYFSAEPISFRGITFFPFPILPSQWQGGIREHAYLQRVILKRRVSCLTVHPSTMVNELDWDLIYYPNNKNSKLNPSNLDKPLARGPADSALIFRRFNLLLRHLKTLQRIRLLEVTPELKTANNLLDPSTINIEECYKKSINWAQGFEYKPKFLYNHFLHFFETNP
jgi:hypothetical protein